MSNKIKKCKVCDEEFFSSHNANYCGPECRLAGSRYRLKMYQEPLYPNTGVTPEKTNIK
jgi:hypothetical protein